MNEHAHADATSSHFFCDMSALSPERRVAHQEVVGELFGTHLRESDELADGYAFRFDSEQYQLVAAFIDNERLCCPFLTFQLEVAPHRGTVRLRITAPSEAKQFIREELGRLVDLHGV
jgi:hypothetical protein